MQDQLPNALSLLRIALAVPIIVLISRDTPANLWTALALFVLAAATDLADGWLARRFNATSVLGSHLDPFADKVLVLAVLATLAATQMLTITGLVAFGLIALREIIATAARVSRLRAGSALVASQFSRTKTMLQYAGICVLLVGAALQRRPVALSGELVLAASAVAGYLSLRPYFRPRRP